MTKIVKTGIIKIGKTGEKPRQKSDITQINERQFSLTNWGGNFNYSTANIVYPKTIKKVQQIVQNAKNVHVLGSTHSFNRIGDSTVELMSLEYLNAILGIETT